MTIDRQEALRRAEALLKQGQIDAAIDEYGALVAAHPADWSSLNILGDLYVRAGQPQQALALYARVADHYLVEGFFARAAGFYKKILKLAPHDEDVRLKLARACAQQGLRLDAKQYLEGIVAARRGRGDTTGAAAAQALIAELDAQLADVKVPVALPVGTGAESAAADGPLESGPTHELHEEAGDAADVADQAELIDHLGSVVAFEVDLTDLVDALARVAAPTPAEGQPEMARPDEGSHAAPQASLDSTFATLRQRAAPGAPDLVALGRTYAAAGMLDEAVEAFQAAAHDASQQYDAAVAMVDICVSRQDPAAVIDWLERAIEAAPTAAKRGAALYRLGLALEQVGESARALAIWLELEAMAPAFRDVSARVARLQGAKNGGAPSGS